MDAHPGSAGSSLGNAYRVNICGESLQLRSDQPPHVIEKVAGFLDARIREISNQTVNGDKFRLVALAAMNLAEELLSMQSTLENYNSYSHRLEKQAKSLSESLDKALGPKS
jgi:cell division protein ZapA